MARSLNSEAEPRDQDSIFIHELSLPVPILAPNVWGDLKAQPALVSLDLHFLSGFGSAANKDQLDDSTVHYGLLAKRIRGICREGMKIQQVFEESFKIVEELAGGVLVRCRISIKLPKGSMLGDGLELVEKRSYGADPKEEKSLQFAGVTVPVLIGVNAYERRRKQPLKLDLTVDLGLEDTRDELFSLEDTMVRIVESTSFETLETLIDFTISKLREAILDRLLPGGWVRLRIQKPMAIVFANAPIVEARRRISSKGSTTDPTAGLKSKPHVRDVAVPGLVISKPYLAR